MRLFSIILMIVGTLMYLANVVQRVGSSWAFNLKVEDAIAVLVIACVAALVALNPAEE